MYIYIYIYLYIIYTLFAFAVSHTPGCKVLYGALISFQSFIQIYRINSLLAMHLLFPCLH